MKKQILFTATLLLCVFASALFININSADNSRTTAKDDFPFVEILPTLNITPSAPQGNGDRIILPTIFISEERVDKTKA